jgi:chromosome segregation ATPase
VQPIERLHQISLKLRRLLNEKQALTERNTKLEKELAFLKEQLAFRQQKEAELTNTIKIIKLAQNISSDKPAGAETTELKRKINEYIKEIDNCIAMLNE